MLRDAIRVGVSPREFWEWTPKELHYHHEGYLWRRDDRGTMFSSFTAALLTPHTKRKVKPSDLYKPVITDPPAKKQKVAERRKQFEEAVKTMGPDAIPIKQYV
jgi:hypothetical protein